ncbi:hypothetical protein L2K20_27855 [Mycobacterium sp. MBM]|nr:hypothetical protein [Mycobacterium sp. MBM]
MNTLRGLFSAALLVAAMIGFAGPAQANPQQQVLEGVYTFKQEGLPEAAWTIYPVCVPVVGDLRVEIRDPVACQLTVSSSPNTVAKGGIAKLTGGQWAYNINSVDGLTCPDGSTAPLLETFKFDTITMTGTRTMAHNQVCGLPATLDTKPFTLTYVEPLPIPVQQYPLYCEPGGLRRCF